MTSVAGDPATNTGGPPSLPKTPTGIQGLDEITGGGLPTGRPTLVTGYAGCGKTLFGIEFLVRGALDYGEPGVLLSFEESADDLADNVASLGWDLRRMQAEGLLVIDAFRIDTSDLVEAGPYDLDGLFIRLGSAVDEVGAKRVVLDTIEVLFHALHDEESIRAGLVRLFRWMKARGLTAVVTGERGADAFSRHGIEEYVSDCVIFLDHRVHDELSTRRLRVVKYRGSLHGTNEYPFLITDRGLAVMPVSAVALSYGAPSERISIGVERLDHLLGGGIYRGSTVLVSGGAGTGKTTLAIKALAAACERGERALLVAFEESPAQLVRDMVSVGIDLRHWLDAGLLRIWAGRPSAYGLELHLATLLRVVEDFEPTVVALDALTAIEHLGEADQIISAVTREIDVMKGRGITTFVTALSASDAQSTDETSAMGVTSLVDTWLLLRNVESNGERNRLLFVRKSRGSAHSNQVREFVLTESGPQLVDVYVDADGVLTGSARLAREADDRRTRVRQLDELELRRRALRRRAAAVDAQVQALRADLQADADEVQYLADSVERGQADSDAEAATLAEHRWADAGPAADTDGQPR